MLALCTNACLVHAHMTVVIKFKMVLPWYPVVQKNKSHFPVAVAMRNPVSWRTRR